MQYVSVRSVASRLSSQFKVDMDIYDCVQACADALKKLGMIALDRAGIVANVSNYCVNLPGSVWKVRSVIKLDEPVFFSGTNTLQDIVFPPQIVFEYDENSLEETSPQEHRQNVIPHYKGPYIPHVWDCPYVRLNETDIQIYAVCTKIKTDADGFPMIPEAAFYGCLYYALYVYYQPLFLLGQIPLYTMQQVEKWKNDNIAQSNSSMMFESLSDNELDEVLNVMTSMDRKSFNYPV